MTEINVDDIVTTPSGRTARVIYVIRATGEIEVEWPDGEAARFRRSWLVKAAEASGGLGQS